MTIERLDLRNSGDTAGPRDRVVGYGAWALYEGSHRRTRETVAVEALGPTLIELARRSIAIGLDTGRPRAGHGRRRPAAAAGRARRRVRHAATPRRRAARLHRLGGRDAAADRRRGAARVQRGVPRLAVPAAGLAGAGGAVAVGLGADAAGADAVRRRGRSAGAASPGGGRADHRGSGAARAVPAQRVGGAGRPAAVPDGAEAEGGHWRRGTSRRTFRAQRFRSIEVKGAMEEGCGAVEGLLGWSVLPAPTARRSDGSSA